MSYTTKSYRQRGAEGPGYAARCRAVLQPFSVRSVPPWWKRYPRGEKAFSRNEPIRSQAVRQKRDALSAHGRAGYNAGSPCGKL
jgi:hypothetical protein